MATQSVNMEAEELFARFFTSSSSLPSSSSSGDEVSQQQPSQQQEEVAIVTNVAHNTVAESSAQNDDEEGFGFAKLFAEPEESKSSIKVENIRITSSAKVRYYQSHTTIL